VNTIEGTQFGHWNGYHWKSELYEDEDGSLNSDFLHVMSWLKTPQDEND